MVEPACIRGQESCTTYVFGPTYDEEAFCYTQCSFCGTIVGGANVQYDFLEGVKKLVHRPRGYYSRDGQVGKEMHLSRRDE